MDRTTNQQEYPRGFLIRVNLNHGGNFSSETPCQLHFLRSSNWGTIYEIVLSEGDIRLIVVGHCYARKASSFDIGETLEILGQEYLKGGLPSVRAAIGGGIFGLFIIDGRRSRFLAISDLLACMPVYFRRHAQGIDIGTSEFDLGASAIDNNACLEYLRFGHLMFAPAFQCDVERLGPGQVLDIDLRDGSLREVAEETYPAYPPPHERIKDLNEACRLLDKALSRYFSRLGDERLAAGLSGGYDSRLIAAYTKSHDCRFVTFDNPGTNETIYAQQVAKALGTVTQVFKIPADAPSRLNEDFVFGMQSMDNLECSHVFALLDALMKKKPAYLIDGLLGDTAIGCGFFYKLHGKLNPVWKTLSLRDRYDLSIDPAYDWVDHMRRHHPRRLPDETLHVLNCAEEEYPFRRTADMVNTAIRAACHTHFDGIDMINYRARTSRVFACGPVTFLRKCPTLTPFYDVDVLKTCMSIDTSLRAGERLYNAFWRYRFPELASIPKESTSGRAKQSDMRYRIAHFNSAVSRRLASRFGGSAKAGGDLGDLLSMYLHDSGNVAFFNRMNKASRDLLAPIGLGPVLDEFQVGRIDKRIYLRAISLANLFIPADIV